MGAFFAPRDWGRLLTAMVTPFGPDGRIDLVEAKRIAGYLVDVQKNDGLVVSGTTGESPTTADDEKIQLLEAVLEAVGDRAAVIAGCGTNDTAHSIHLTKLCDAIGAHGIMLVNPYYNRPSQAGLEAHFSAIARETDLPVMLYNIQPRSAVNLETETLMRLAEIPNIVAVKEASGNLGQISDVCRLAPSGFRVYSGDDALTLPILSLGGHGLVSVAAHCVGSQLKEMIERFPGDPAGASAIHHRLTPFIKAVFSAPSPSPIKAALASAGFACESVRMPMIPLTAEQKMAVLNALQTTRD
ncbi:MAG: 4-hydroxy-tetrahydrodipicolinate synthase [Armatimonadetes bacterium]|nr:4-hydroxy-tetrahydrodipicolinate synthase [Armatimonadota bacterium]